MNPEEKFEQALMRDIASASRHDPTSAWKADILARATARPTARVITFPRLILLAWAACWTVALVLQFMTPNGSAERIAQSGRQPAPSIPTDWRALQNQRATMLALLASNDTSNLSRP